MKILHSLDNSNRGGIQALIFDLYRFSRHEHEFWAADGSMAPEMRAAGMLLWDGGPPPERRYDVLVGHGVCGWSSHDLAGYAHDRGMKIVECIHSVCQSITPAADLDGFVAMSELTLARNGHMPRAVCLYAPIDVSKFGLTHGPGLGKLGRLVQEKSPQDFVEIARHFPDEAFLLAGDGVMFDQLRAAAPANVQMLGWVTDHPDFYNKLKLFVFPSRDECLSMSLARAQAAGLPCLVQDTPALRASSGGQAVYCGSVPEFVAQVSRFLSDPPAFAALGAASREWAWQRFDRSVTMTAWDAYLESFL